MTYVPGLCVALHGGPGMGKSTLATTAPGPRLHLDTEGGGEWLAGKVIIWSDLSKLPEGIDENTTVTVSIVGDKAMDTFQSVYQWLAVGKHPFNSVILDSVTELQKRVRDRLTPPGGGDIDYVTLQSIMEKLIRELKDLKVHATKRVLAVVFVTGTEDKMSDKKVIARQPALIGKLATNLPHMVDVCGHVTLQYDAESKQLIQYMQILPFDDVLKVKDRTSPPGRTGLSTLFSAVITQPNITTMIQALNQAQAVA